MINANEAKLLSVSRLEHRISDLITELACKGSFRVYIEGSSELSATITVHPSKQEILDLLKISGYDVYDTQCGGMVISWE